MATGSQLMTTYYAKRIMGDNAAADASDALLQTGEHINVDTWILHRENRTNLYGIKYKYDNTETSNVNNGHDKIELYGGYQISNVNMPTAWVQLDTGDIHTIGSFNGDRLNLIGAGNTVLGYDENNTAPYIELRNSDNTKNIRISLATISNKNGITINQQDNIQSFLSVHGYLWLYSPNVDMTDANNGVSSGSIIEQIQAIDSNGYDFGLVQFNADSSGAISNLVCARNIVDSTNKYIGIYSVLNKDGTGNIYLRNNAATAQDVIACEFGSTENAIAAYGCLSLFPTSTNYREGLRIHSISDWSDITLCGNDNTGDSGTSTNSWFLGNNNGNFYIARNGSPGSTAYLSCVNNAWTFLNKVRIASTEDINLGANGAFIIGATNSTNIGIDDDEIMARNNSAASTLYLNSEGGQVYIGSGGLSVQGQIYGTWLRIVNNSSDNTDDAMVYLESTTATDWALKINKGGKRYGIFIDSLDQDDALRTNGYIRARAIWANQGSNGERQVGVDSTTSGNLYFYAHTSGKGIYSGSGYKTGTIVGITSSAVTFYGALSGNASTATKLSTTGGAAKFWRGDNVWSDTISGGTLKITANSNTVTIGSQNGSWCHFTNSANINFYFNHQIHAVDGFVVYNTNTKLTNNSLAFASGGGWSMSDTTWIRTVGSKSVYMNAGTFRCDGTIQAGSSGNYTWSNGGVLTTSRLIATSATDAAGNAANAVALVVGGAQTAAHIEMDNNEIIAKSNGTTKVSLWFNDSAEVTADGKVKNAVWNDYAEYRQADTIAPGYCVATQEDGIMHITNSRMCPGARIVSDTFGHAIGMSDTAKTPIAVAGRVLVYPYQDKNNYHIGDCVCATYDGKVDIMTREEIKEYPDRIVGIVDEIPNYNVWEQSYTFYKTGEPIKSKIKVKDRIWIYVK